jgi:hypothetical protein
MGIVWAVGAFKLGIVVCPGTPTGTIAIVSQWWQPLNWESWYVREQQLLEQLPIVPYCMSIVLTGYIPKRFAAPHFVCQFLVVGPMSYSKSPMESLLAFSACSFLP